MAFHDIYPGVAERNKTLPQEVCADFLIAVFFFFKFKSDCYFNICMRKREPVRLHGGWIGLRFGSRLAKLE